MSRKEIDVTLALFLSSLPRKKVWGHASTFLSGGWGVRKLILIPTVVQQNITNKSCLICVMSEKYAFWVTLRPKSDRCRQGEAKVRILNFITTWSEFQKASQTAIDISFLV